MENTNLSFDAFNEELTKEIQKLFGSDYTVESRPVEKMNESYQALTVKPNDSSIGVNINVTKSYSEYQDGKDLHTIASQLTEVARNAIDGRPDFDLDALTDYTQMKEKLSIQVVSTERNTNLLETVPHKDIEDMSIVYRFVLDSSEAGRSSILVTNKMLETYGVSAEQLHTDAMMIAPDIRPAVIKGLSEVMAEMMGHDQAEMLGLSPNPDELIYVASVKDNMQGAGVLAYRDFMDQAAKKLGGDFYILPSSIHEILLVKDNGQFDNDALEQMVRDVNATQVAPEDKLTDNVYHYDSKAHVFELAGKFESRERSEESSEEIA